MNIKPKGDYLEGFRRDPKKLEALLALYPDDLRPRAKKLAEFFLKEELVPAEILAQQTLKIAQIHQELLAKFSKSKKDSDPTYIFDINGGASGIKPFPYHFVLENCTAIYTPPASSGGSDFLGYGFGKWSRILLTFTQGLPVGEYSLLINCIVSILDTDAQFTFQASTVPPLCIPTSKDLILMGRNRPGSSSYSIVFHPGEGVVSKNLTWTVTKDNNIAFARVDSVLLGESFFGCCVVRDLSLQCVI